MRCILGVFPIDKKQPQDLFIIGSILMQQFYFVFDQSLDQENNPKDYIQVGIAEQNNNFVPESNWSN